MLGSERFYFIVLFDERSKTCYIVPVFSPAKIEGVGEKHILGGASVHIKGLGSIPIPLQRQISTEGIGGPSSFKYAGENTVYISVWTNCASSTIIPSMM